MFIWPIGGTLVIMEELDTASRDFLWSCWLMWYSYIYCILEIRRRRKFPCMGGITTDGQRVNIGTTITSARQHLPFQMTWLLWWYIRIPRSTQRADSVIIAISLDLHHVNLHFDPMHSCYKRNLKNECKKDITEKGDMIILNLLSQRTIWYFMNVESWKYVSFCVPLHYKESVYQLFP